VTMDEIRALDALKTWKELEEAKERIVRLESAGDAMVVRLQLWKISNGEFLCEHDAVAIKDWTEAKEDRP
jgi:hypothetical protein